MREYISLYNEAQNEKFQGDDYYDKKYKNYGEMRELEFYLENDEQLYKQLFVIIKNIQKKIKSGKYDHKFAPKLWMYFVENAAKKYAKEFASSPAEWKDKFIKSDRMILAQKLADYYFDNIENYSNIK